jgi:hypothetical protein
VKVHFAKRKDHMKWRPITPFRVCDRKSKKKS